MNKITNQRFNETFYEQTVGSGLRVVVMHKPGYIGSSALIATPFGGMHTKLKDNEGNIVDIVPGSAHFLEHKLFESEEGDIMTAFTEVGASVNAFTSYEETVYYFSTSNDIEKPLNMLLDFVSDLKISEQSVEKEKGIIIQELRMYAQMPDSRLVNETYRSLFVEHPFSNDIGGSEESVTSITKEHLELCYRLNYHPQRMLLVVATGEEPERIFDLAEKNHSTKSFDHAPLVESVKVNEPNHVFREKFDFILDVQSLKSTVTFKLNHHYLSERERKNAEWSLRLLMEATFSTLNPAYQRWMDDGVISDFFGFEVDLGEGYGLLMFYNETDDSETFEKFLEVEISKCTISAVTLEQLKRRYLGQAFRSLNDLEDMAISFIRATFAKADFFDSLTWVEDITLLDIENVRNIIDLNNKCVVSIKK
ncbi:MAG: pitrilysin family protein [Erysipelotrichaceae bacterium]|nr:pitrilysin family protein [Erysipelotrichaceae bacterium]MDP3306325.1 pitrilysin family protein [Erysipelotrichaceae bacterium]